MVHANFHGNVDINAPQQQGKPSLSVSQPAR